MRASSSGSRPHTSSGPQPSAHPPTRHTRRHALPARPSTSSGVPDQTNPHPVAIVVTSPFAGVSPVPVRLYLRHQTARRSCSLRLQVCRFHAHPPKKRQEAKRGRCRRHDHRPSRLTQKRLTLFDRRSHYIAGAQTGCCCPRIPIQDES
jgi:hypothetical protein